MKLWILRPVDNLNYEDNPWDPWYNKSFGFVVRAETENEARRYAHHSGGNENQKDTKHNTARPWKDQKYSTCTELIDKGRRGIVIMDYHAA